MGFFGLDAASVGMIAGTVGILGFVPYAVGIINRTTKPNKATWIVWAVLGAVIAASYYAAGATESAWVPVAYAFGIFIIAILSLKYGEEKWTPLDKGCLAGAALGLALWALTGEAATALYIATLVDAAGSVPTIRKTYEDPGSESRAAWALFLLAAVINLFAIREWTLSSASYPVYLVILDLVMIALVLRKPRNALKECKKIKRKEAK